MNKKYWALLICVLLISTVMIQTTFALTQSEQDAIDAVSGPAFPESDDDTAGDSNDADYVEYGTPGECLGAFSITGYCDYNQSTSAGCLTATGTAPLSQHTIAADWSLLAPGTRVLIGDSDIVYTVEDKGSAVKGNVIDIFYNSKEEALSNGRWSSEIYLAQ